MDDNELRELQDPSTWDFDRAEVHPPVPGAGGVVAVRFSAEEFGRLTRQAAAAGQSLAGFVHDAVLERLARQPAGRS